MNKNIYFFDGAIGTEILKQDVENKDCLDILNIENPQLIKNIHLKYIQSGAQIITTNTFQANGYSLAKYGYNNLCEKINEEAVRIVRDCFSDLNKKALKIAGSIGPSTIMLSTVSKNDYLQIEKALRIGYKRQIDAFFKESVNYLLIETITDTKNLLLILEEIKKLEKQYCFKIPVIANFTFNPENGKLFSGEEFKSILPILESYNIFALGLNCFNTKNNHFKSIVTSLQNINKPIMLSPNHVLTKKKIESFKLNNLLFIGGCCGTTPNCIETLIIDFKK